MSPRFSILTPTRDRAPFVRRCVRSVLSQTHDDFEQIVFDNGVFAIGDLLPQDPRIRYIRGEAEGPADAFQQALDFARGEIIHPLSDDDQLVPEALAVVDREIGEAEWLNGLTVVEDRDGNELQRLGGRVRLDRLQRGYYLSGAIYWRRELTDRLGGFDTDFDGAADFDLYLRFAHAATPKFVDQVLYRYCEHPETDSRKMSKRQREAGRRIMARERG